MVVLDNLGEHVENNQNNEATNSFPDRSDVNCYYIKRNSQKKRKLKIEIALNFQRALNLLVKRDYITLRAFYSHKYTD